MWRTVPSSSASWRALRSVHSRAIASSRATGSASASGRSTKKNESSLPSASLRSSARCRLTGTFTRIRCSGASRASSQRRRPPAVAPSTTSLTVRCVPNASRSRPIAARSVDANAAAREDPTRRASDERGTAGASSRSMAADSRGMSARTWSCVGSGTVAFDGPVGGASTSHSSAVAIRRTAMPSAIAWWTFSTRAWPPTRSMRPQRPIAVQVLLHELRDRVLQRAALRVLADVLVEVEPRDTAPTPGRRRRAPAGLRGAGCGRAARRRERAAPRARSGPRRAGAR